jgi:hypothetical protein
MQGLADCQSAIQQIANITNLRYAAAAVPFATIRLDLAASNQTGLNRTESD